MSERRLFPILVGQRQAWVPWSVLAPHEKQAHRNHGQSLERLAERGGLAIQEAAALVTDQSWMEFADRPDIEAWAVVYEAIVGGSPVEEGAQG